MACSRAKFTFIFAISVAVCFMYRGFWVVTRRHIFGANRRFRTTFCKGLKSSPETSVNTKNMTPGNNPEASIHNNSHGESLQSHISVFYFSG
jgi:hypothetical protein